MSVVRESDGVNHALRHPSMLKDAYSHVTVNDKGRSYNKDVMEALKLEHTLDAAEVMVHGTLAREESRGAHFRNDFQERNDARWLKLTMIRTAEGIRTDCKPVIIRFESKERKH